jgi:hypothetical protein
MILFAAVTETANWSTTFNTFGLLGLAALQALGIWWARQNHAVSHSELAAVKGQVTQVAGEVKEVRQAVDGPLGNALSNAATALEVAADLTRDPERILKAVAARKLSDDHNASQAAALLAKEKNETDEKEIIRKYLERQKLPPQQI